MDTRPPASEVIKGLSTTADKIRALASANYDRTEISKILGIRYQHVRHVMLRSGMTGGLRREFETEREPVEVDAAPAPREDTSWTLLTDAGFEFIGEWTQDPESLLRLDARAPDSPGVYAFIADDIMVYVGLTLNGLKARFDQYRRGHKGQRTSSRIKRRIADTAGRKESQGAGRHARAVRMAGAPGEHRSGTGSRAHRDDPPLLEYPGRAMTEHSNDHPPPAVLPASPSGNALPSPLVRLAEIPEEEIWLAKQKNKHTRRAYKLDVQHFMRTFHITSSEELRKVDHRAVIAWERIMHSAVSDEDFAKDPGRNRLAVVLSRTNHMSYHLGQIMLVHSRH